MGDFASISWGKQGHFLSNAKWENLQVFPGGIKGQCYLTQVGDFVGISWGKQGQCYLTPSGICCRYFLGYTRLVLSNAKWEILQVFPGV